MSQSKFYHFHPSGIYYSLDSAEKAIMALKEGGFIWLNYFESEKAIFHFSDIYDHLAKFLELNENYREIVTSLMELYTSLLNNIMTNASNQTNLSVRRLTLIATIFMPLILLASIGGMSEWSMMTGPGNWKVAYPLFIIGMAVIGLLSYLLIKKIERKTDKPSS
jgi:magnesium transporter